METGLRPVSKPRLSLTGQRVSGINENIEKYGKFTDVYVPPAASQTRFLSLARTPAAFTEWRFAFVFVVAALPLRRFGDCLGPAAAWPQRA